VQKLLADPKKFEVWYTPSLPAGKVWGVKWTVDTHTVTGDKT